MYGKKLIHTPGLEMESETCKMHPEYRHIKISQTVNLNVDG